MDSYLQLTIPVETDLQKEILVAELLSTGFESFQEEPWLLKAFVQEQAFNKKEVEEILHRYELVYALESVPIKNRNEEWEKNFTPVVIGDWCSVRASFHEPNKNTKIEIVINPKMSFGTGHHATTYQMLEMMKGVNLKDAAVLDFGTGTGILAIMADKLEEKEVLAIDVDEWSIENARENLEINNCSRVHLLQTDNIPVDKSFNIILANINRNVILEGLPAICKILEAKGKILLSGLMEADFEIVNNEASILGLYLQIKGEKSGWISLRYGFQSET
jgi:ribosomal protein L11 methyltransferase